MSEAKDNIYKEVEWEGEYYRLPIVGRGINTSVEQKVTISLLICSMYATGQYTIASCCRHCGVEESTFAGWRKRVPEIQELYNRARVDAKGNYAELVETAAKDAVLRIIKGEFTREVKKVERVVELINGTPTEVGRRVTTTEQWLRPSSALLMGMMELTDPEKYSKTLMIDRAQNGASSNSLIDIINSLKVSDDMDDGEKVLPPLTSEDAAREYGLALKDPTKKD